MPNPFIDLTHPAYGPTVPKPRGLLPVPSTVREAVGREEARVRQQHGVTLTPEAHRRLLNDQTLDWYYRDQWVSYRETDQGVEVLAVGLEEAEKLEQKLPPAEFQAVRTRQV